MQLRLEEIGRGHHDTLIPPRNGLTLSLRFEGPQGCVYMEPETGYPPHFQTWLTQMKGEALGGIEHTSVTWAIM